MDPDLLKNGSFGNRALWNRALFLLPSLLSPDPTALSGLVWVSSLLFVFFGRHVSFKLTLVVMLGPFGDELCKRVVKVKTINRKGNKHIN